MTYRRRVLIGVLAAMIALAWTSTVGQAQKGAASSQKGTVAKTAWGDPDLQGTWRNFDDAPYQRPREFGERMLLTDAELAAKQKAKDANYAKLAAGRLIAYDGGGLPSHNSNWGFDPGRRPATRRTSAIIDPPNGRLPPWTPAALKRWEAMEAATVARGVDEHDAADRGISERCVTAVAGNELIGFQFNKGGLRQILQSPGYAAIVTGESALHRIVPLDARPPLSSTTRQWRGDSRGRWDGNTLVVETTNINDKQKGHETIIPSFRSAIFRAAFNYPGSGEMLRIIERYARTGPDTLEYRYTVDDPQTFTRPYTAVYELTRDDGLMIFADQCHEGNDGLAGQLASQMANPKFFYDERIQISKERVRRIEELKAEWEAWKQGRTYTPERPICSATSGQDCQIEGAWTVEEEEQ